MSNDAMDDRALNQFLDDLAVGRGSDAVEGLDRSLGETMLELRSLAQAPLPAFSQQRVDRQVQSAMSQLARGERKDVLMNQSILTNVLPRDSGSNGYASGFGKLAGATTAPRSAHRMPRAMTWFAAAALLALTAGVGYFFFGPPRADPEPPAILAAATQPATPEDASEVSFDITLSEPVLPASTIYSWATMYSVEPGLSAEYPGFPIESPVATLIWVQSGTLALTGDHGKVHRGSAARPDASPVAGELLLGPDDAVALELGGDHSYQLRSAGSEPLVFAEFWLIAGPEPLYMGQTELDIMDYYHDSSAVTLPAASTATMHLTKTTLAMDETLEPPEGSFQNVLAEDHISIIRMLPDGVASNIVQNDLVTVVVMTADFQPMAGTPSAATQPQTASEATPEDAIEQQFDITLSEPVLPAGPIYLWSTMYSILPGVRTEYPGFPIDSPVAALV
jgi:hypothetical protein